LLNTFKTILKWVAAIVVICVVAVFLASINGLSVQRTIATIGENEVTEAEYKYYLETIKEQMLTEANATDEKAFWESEIDGKKASDVAKEKALDELIRTEIAIIKANEAGISLSSEEVASARAIINATDTETKAQLKEIKKETGADKYQIADIMEKAYLANAYYQSVVEQENSPVTADDALVKKYAEENYALVKHALVLNAPQVGTTPEDPEKYKEDAKKRADEALEKAVKGEDFESIISVFGEDPGMTQSPEGYLIDKTGMSADGSGKMVDEFTKGTFAVSAGEVNPSLVESTYGWHIIKRYPLPKTGENYDAMIAAAQSAVLSESYNAHIDSFKDGLTISVKENVIAKIKVK